jgi:DNA-binding PadR family transcriptional regulator
MPTLPDLGRFTDVGILLLISLSGGDKHGYAIMDDIQDLTGHRPGPGTLYGAIARLEALGWIEPAPSDDRRKPYRLTGNGRAALHEQLSIMNHLVVTGSARLGQTT